MESWLNEMIEVRRFLPGFALIVGLLIGIWIGYFTGFMAAMDR